MPTLPRPLNRRDLITLALILLIAAGLRLGDPGRVEFFHDEAMLSLLAQDMTRGGDFPLTGISSSVGIPNPPVTVYVLAIPYLFTDDPLIATLYIALLNVIGVGLLWFIARRYFSTTAALIAGLTYAVSPWAVLYSRKIWAQDFLTPFLLLGFLLALLGLVEHRRWAQVLSLPVLIFACQIHFAAWALLPAYLLLLLTTRHQSTDIKAASGRWRTIGISLMLTVIVLLPYLAGLAQTLATDPTRITSALNRSDPTQGLTLSGDALRFTTYLTTGLGMETWVAPQQQTELLTRVPVLPAIWLLIGAGTLIGLAALWLTPRFRRLAGFVSAWTLLPLLVFTPTWTTVYPHYFIGALPAFALLTGIGIEQVMQLAGRLAVFGLPAAPATAGSRSRLPRIVILTGFAAILLTQAVWWRGLMRFVDAQEISLGAGTSGYTTPVYRLLAVRDAVRPADDVVIVSNGMHVLFDVEPARWAVLLRDSARCVRTLPGDGFAVFPPHPFTAIIAPNAPPGGITNLYQTVDARTFPARPGGGGYTVSSFTVPSSLDTVAIKPVEPVRFAHEVVLTGYALTPERVYLEWSLPAAQALDYQFFTHLLTADGERIHQQDSSFWSGRHWCAGDRLLTWQPKMIPADATGAALLRVGFYRLSNDTAQPVLPIDVLDVMGNPAGNWTDIPLTGN